MYYQPSLQFSKIKKLNSKCGPRHNLCAGEKLQINCIRNLWESGFSLRCYFFVWNTCVILRKKLPCLVSLSYFFEELSLSYFHPTDIYCCHSKGFGLINVFISMSKGLILVLLTDYCIATL